MNINDLNIGQAKELVALLAPALSGPRPQEATTLNSMLGQSVIVRTYSAGVWFGVLSEKYGNEVILTQARRMYRWWAAESISLSAVALHGIREDKSQIVEAVPSVWMEAIEIIPCSLRAAKQLKGAANVKAQ